MKHQVELDEKGEKEMSRQQQKALHVLFDKVAELFNDAGLDMKAVLKPEVEIPWTKDTVKKFLWKPIQKLMLGKEHSADLMTKEVDDVFEVFNRHVAKHGIHQPFPSIEALIREMQAKDAMRLKAKKK